MFISPQAHLLFNRASGPAFGDLSHLLQPRPDLLHVPLMVQL
jgi:hypothetical protein